MKDLLQQSAFEKYATDTLGLSIEKDACGNYANPQTSENWDAWRAGRTSHCRVMAASNQWLDTPLNQRELDITFVDWKWIELPPSLKEHHAFDVLQTELAKVGVKVRP